MGDTDAAFGALTQYRRRIRRLGHSDHSHLPIVFNDYMNCLMGDPTDAKILALIEPVARSGAEYFVIDAGWYADDNDGWDDVRAWEPSQKRLPMGFKNLLDKIREAGLKPGLWIEAEVIGVRSPVTDELPPEAYFQRDDERILEKNRYQLDFRHPAVIARMDGIINRLVTEYGVAYFKFDYNIEPVWDDETNALTVVNALFSGRVHLSGRLDLLAPRQLELVCRGMEVYKEIRGDLASAVPFWPLGFAKWHDDWLAAGLRVIDGEDDGSAGKGGQCHLAIWRRAGGQASCELPLSFLEGARDVSTSLLYPDLPGPKLEVVGETSLRPTIASTIGARLFCVIWS
ncbi:hypothetical protein PG988_006394 [Apiospora saccharicola]